MTSSADLRVIFRVAAGPRRGFGHLVRALSLARAMGVRPLLSVRGSRRVAEMALALGADVLADASARALRRLRPDLVIVDDPIARTARAWIAGARAAGAVVATIHDLGIGCPGADIVIDGSITRTAESGGSELALVGPRYAILDPDLRRHASTARKDASRRVLVALGGGPRRERALAIAAAIAAADRTVEVRVAGGFVASVAEPTPRVTWVPATRGLGTEMSKATVAVVGGGVSLYEACALGVPAVGLPVVRAQVPTVRAFARRGAAVSVPFAAPDRRAAADVIALLDDPRQRARMARRSMRIVDGLGAARTAAAVLTFMKRRER